MVKKFEEFINEFYEPESHFRLKDIYANDASFRRSVDNGTLRYDSDVSGGGVKPNIDEVFYGILTIQKGEKFIKNSNKEMKVRLEVLNDDSHRLMTGTAPMDQIANAFQEMVDNLKGEEKEWFDGYDETWIDGLLSRRIYAKVGCKWGADKNLMIGSVQKFFITREDMDEDVIETLRAK